MNQLTEIIMRRQQIKRATPTGILKICPKCGELVPLETEICMCLLDFKHNKDLQYKEKEPILTDEKLQEIKEKYGELEQVL